MSTNWTEDQQRAICETGGNILVSAAAGSGKTAVLIERILKAVQEKTDIDRLLVVTFTTAAAAELRERLYFPCRESWIPRTCPQSRPDVSAASRRCFRNRMLQPFTRSVRM